MHFAKYLCGQKPVWLLGVFSLLWGVQAAGFDFGTCGGPTTVLPQQKLPRSNHLDIGAGVIMCLALVNILHGSEHGELRCIGRMIESVFLCVCVCNNMHTKTINMHHVSPSPVGGPSDSTDDGCRLWFYASSSATAATDRNSNSLWACAYRMLSTRQSAKPVRRARVKSRARAAIYKMCNLLRAMTRAIRKQRVSKRSQAACVRRQRYFCKHC